MAEKIEQVGGDVPAPGTKRKTNEPGPSGPQCGQLPTGDQQTQSDIRHNPALKAPITSKLDFVRFLDHFLPNLLLLSVVLGIESQAADILKDRSNATEKCLNILGMWLSVTANPTWELFCSLLQRHATFNHVRSLIEAGSCTLLALPGGQEQTKVPCSCQAVAHRVTESESRPSSLHSSLSELTDTVISDEDAASRLGIVAALDLSAEMCLAQRRLYADKWLDTETPVRKLRTAFFHLLSHLAKLFDKHIGNLRPFLRTCQKSGEWPYKELEVEDINNASTFETIFNKVCIENFWLDTRILICLSNVLPDEKSRCNAEMWLEAYHKLLGVFSKFVLLKHIPEDDARLEHFRSSSFPKLRITYDVNLEDFAVSELLEQQKFLSIMFDIPKEAFHYLEAKNTNSTLVAWALSISSEKAFTISQMAAQDSETLSLQENSVIRFEIEGVCQLHLKERDLTKLIKEALLCNSGFRSCTEHVSRQFLALVDPEKKNSEVGKESGGIAIPMLVGGDVPTPTTKPPKYFDARILLTSYQDKLTTKVAAKHLATKLRNEGLISEHVKFRLENTDPEEARQILFADLVETGTPEKIRGVCSIMTSEVGYPAMNALGKSILEDQDLSLPTQPDKNTTTLPGGQEQTKTLCDNPHVQKLKMHVTNHYVKKLKCHAESGVPMRYVQLALLEAQQNFHNHEEGSNKLRFLENFRKCGGKSGKVLKYVTPSDLLKPICDRINRLKVVYGQAGIGKTTMLTHICKSLALSEIKSSYPLVLYFPLRDKAVSSANTLDKLLSYYASSDLKLDLSAVQQALVDSDGKEVLFIFDGADEVQDLLSSEERGVVQDLLEGNVLPQADVIVSSRPGGLPQLKKQNVATFYEIHGFDAQSIEKYIKELFKASPEKGERLWKELQSRDDLMGAAHIPMNLLIFCAILGDAHLPPTITECYKQHIVQVHYKESPGKNWTDFDECPKDVEQLLLSLGRLAYNGMMSTPSTFVFTEKDVKLAVEGTSLDKSAFKGLLHEHPSTSGFISKSTFNFTHTTQQEFFSAYYIKHLQVEKQIDFLQTNMSIPRFSMVLRFYAGLTKLADEKIVSTLLHEPGFFDRPFLQSPFSTDKTISALHVLSCDNEMPGLLQLFHFLYESQSPELTQSVARHLNGKSITFSLFLTSYDSRVIAHCLRETPYLEELTFHFSIPMAEHVLLSTCSILMSDSVTGIKSLFLRVEHLTQANGSLLKEGLARTAVEVLVLHIYHAGMSAVAAIFQAPGPKSIDLHVYEDVHHGGDSDREVAQPLARNTSIKELEFWSPPSLLLPVVKGLATNTCVEKLDLCSLSGGDGGVGQALATACTTNTTLEDIKLEGVSAFPLMKALASRQVPLERLDIEGHPPNKDPNPCTPETLETLAQNMKVKRFKWIIRSWTIAEAKPFVDGLSRNKFLEDIYVMALRSDDNVKNYITTKLSSLKKVRVRIR